MAARLMAAGLALTAAGMAKAAPPPVPPPVEQHTADCAHPVFATDQLVCADPALRTLDARLGTLLASASPPESRWVEPQWQWFQRRSRCAFSKDHKGCVEAAYRERLALFEPPPRVEERRAIKCEGADLAAVGVQNGKIILFGPLGEVWGLAWSEPSAKVWTPFLTALRRGREVSLHTIEGVSSRCRIER